MSANTFAFESQGYIFFLSTNTQQNIIRYDIYGKRHRVISDSKIKNKHIAISELNSMNINDYLILNFEPHGVQIGEFYWIILGSQNTGFFLQLTHTIKVI